MGDEHRRFVVDASLRRWVVGIAWERWWGAGDRTAWEVVLSLGPVTISVIVGPVASEQTDG